ncbi:MAG: MoxR family ATPase [Deltaproteobacteria bacterium]|nr:MoxR family ATPase [Deltaproteobacteria bacterium]
MTHIINTDRFERFTGTGAYVASRDLQEAVNVALALSRPLLVKGEPGTGKTHLARAVAEALGRPLLTWHVKSTSKAQEGLYTYDAVQRLHDSRFNAAAGAVADARKYIRYGALGRAFLSPEPCVVLIDEVDKADLEFPNDLLHELDAMSFAVYETGDAHVAVHRPLVVITSNNEKELPDAFLRRCVFHFISFPTPEQMREIVRVHHPDLEGRLVSEAVTRFYWLRGLSGLRKPPSTSELVDWLSALSRGGVPAEEVAARVPFLGALLKKEQDLAAAARALAGRGGR